MTVHVKIPDSPLFTFDINSDVLRNCLIDIVNKQALLNDELTKVHTRCNELEKSLEAKNELTNDIIALRELPNAVSKLENMMTTLQTSQDKLDAQQHEADGTIKGLQEALDEEEKARVEAVAQLENRLVERMSQTETSLKDCVRLAEAATTAAKKISATEAVIRNIESDQTKVTIRQIELDDGLKGMINSVEANRIEVERLREGAKQRAKEVAGLCAAVNDLSLTKAEQGTIDALSSTIDSTLGAVQKNLAHITEIDLPHAEQQMREEVRLEMQLMCDRCDDNYQSLLAKINIRQSKSAGTMKCLLCKEVRNDRDDGFVEGYDGKWYADPRSFATPMMSARHAQESLSGEARAISAYRAKQMGGKSRLARVISHANQAGATKGRPVRPTTAPQFRPNTFPSRSTPTPGPASTPPLEKLGWKNLAATLTSPGVDSVIYAISNDDAPEDASS